MRSCNLRFIPLMLAVAATACARLPGAEELEAGQISSLNSDWDGLISAANLALGKAQDPEIVFFSLASRCDSYVWKGQAQTALDDCNGAIRAKPLYYGYPYAARARLFAIQGQYEWALEEYDIALELGGYRTAPIINNPTVLAFAGKARIFATSTDPEYRDKELAVSFAEKAVELEKGVNTPAHKILIRDTLAAAYAEIGRFSDAIETQKKSIAMVTENGWQSMTYGGKPLVQILTDHLRTFEANKPLRGGIY